MDARDAFRKLGHPVAPPRADVWLWISVLASPWIVLVYELAVYALVPHACRNDHRWVMHAVSAGALMGIVLALGGSVRGWRAHGSRWPAGEEPPRDGARLTLGSLGVMLALLSLLAVLWQWLAVFLESPCKL